MHRYEEVKAVLRDPAMFSSQRRTALLVDPDPARVEAMSNMLINMDPPKHSQYRRLVAAIFTPRRLEALRPRVEAIAKGVIDRIAPNGTADGINDIAAQLPMRVIADLLGVPERSEQIFDISNRMVGAVGGGPDTRLEQSLEAALEIHLLGQEIAREKRGSDDGTVMSAYVNGTLEGVEGDQRGATDEEAGWFLMLMSVGGNETVRTATAQAIRILAEWPDQRDLLVSDLDRHIPGAVEEILRYRAPLRNIRRTANAGTEIDGRPIDEGDKVVCSFTAALRDPRVFDEPDVFDITREQPRTQLAFGFGEHYCLGANLARLQLQVILREIYSRIPDIHPSGEVVHQPTALFAGLLSMPVAFTPEN
ncbi:MAG: cytochrome P450 [Acidimicrobiaceae bacterium]|nr:cytochrome P450 [Acidimicrobiaceae bacterium]MYE97890.1 cytochrome P450 [Acidimicrobiaceae bacterium]MYI54945.1 cytochrome P450 [Acidimicrobiaceae bacterium]MYJ81469.1 cytochrome P450 [Acidimicrobiaceae bacterium]